MKKLTFSVTLTFADKISDDNEIMEVAKNIAEALENEAKTKGIAPEVSETYTTGIEVASPHIEDSVVIKL